MESIEVIRKLFTGKVVKYQGDHIRLESARLYTMPDTPPPIYVATAGPIQSRRTGEFCDGIITVGAADDKISMLMEKFEEGARRADKDPSTMPRMIQLHVSWAESQEEAEEQAVREWPNGGMPFPKADIRNPEDFAAMARQVGVENFKNRVLMSADLDEHLDHVQHYVDPGFESEVCVHNVGRRPGGVRWARLRRARDPQAPLAGEGRPRVATADASAGEDAAGQAGHRFKSSADLTWKDAGLRRSVNQEVKGSAPR